MTLYLATIPSYESYKDGKTKKDEPTINADDPKNNDIIDKLLFGN